MSDSNYSGSSFPVKAWDGATRNSWRTNPHNRQAPDYNDWERLVAELIATQQFVIQIAGPIDRYSALAAENIFPGAIVRLLPSGELVLADLTFKEVAGMATSYVAAGQPCDYVRRGRAHAASWSPVTGTPLLNIGKTYFLGFAGTLLEDSPEYGFIVPLGQAQTNQVFDFSIGTPVRV